MDKPIPDNNQVWKRRYVLVLVINLIMIIAFAVIGHFFNK